MTAPENSADPKPQPPQPPAEGDCCHSGCMHCVMDMYEDELYAWQQALKIWEAKRL